MNLKLILILLAATPLISFAQKKENIDSLVIQFLRQQPNTPSPFIEITKKGKRGTVSRNYFYNAGDTITKDGLLITEYVFGSAESHATKYFLLCVDAPHQNAHHIIDDQTVEQAIKHLLQLTEGFKLSDAQKAYLINQLTLAYY